MASPAPFSRYEFMIAWRYLRARRAEGGVSVMTWISLIGIALGVMALIATLCCLVIGYPFAFILARLPQKVRPLLLFLLIVPFWTNSLIRIYGLKLFLSTRGYLNDALLWIGVIDKPLRIMYTSEAVILGLVYILLPFMVMPLYSSIEKLDRPLLEAAKDLGASEVTILRKILLPLALPVIMVGVRTALVLAVGTASFGFLINAGGLGSLIDVGVDLYRSEVLISGGLLIAVLALLIDWAGRVLEFFATPKGLR